MHRKNLYLLLAGSIVSHVGTGITMLAIPWLLIKKMQATGLYGYLMIAGILMSIVLLPFVGIIVDHYSRKKTLIATATFGGIVTAIFAYTSRDSYSVNTLTAIYLLGYVVYNLRFPTLLAFIQEIFPREMYDRINGIMEVQSQVAMMTAGGIAGMLIDTIPLYIILIADACTYLCAIILFSLIRYHRQNSASQGKKDNPWQGFIYIRKFPREFLFLFMSVFPFITLTGFNYLLPTHIIRVFEESARVFGWAEIVWAAGSIAAGIIIPILLRNFSTSKIISVCFAIFCVSMGIHAFNVLVWLFVFNVFFMGWGNASIRVARNTAMMQMVENKEIGRVNTAIFSLVNIVQIVLIVILTSIVDSLGTSYCFFVLFLVLIGSLYLFFRNGYTTEGMTLNHRS